MLRKFVPQFITQLQTIEKENMLKNILYQHVVSCDTVIAFTHALGESSKIPKS